MAQHGESELHQKVHQTVERRLVDAGDHSEGETSVSNPSLLFFVLKKYKAAHQYNLSIFVKGFTLRFSPIKRKDFTFTIISFSNEETSEITGAGRHKLLLAEDKSNMRFCRWNVIQLEL